MKRKKEPDVIPMKCAVCNECYREVGQPADRCHFGGPYSGYCVDEDYNLSLLTNKT